MVSTVHIQYLPENLSKHWFEDRPIPLGRQRWRILKTAIGYSSIEELDDYFLFNFIIINYVILKKYYTKITTKNIKYIYTYTYS